MINLVSIYDRIVASVLVLFNKSVQLLMPFSKFRYHKLLEANNVMNIKLSFNSIKNEDTHLVSNGRVVEVA